MKKASKILTLILIVVFVLTVFAGCRLVGRDVASYRNAEALKVGDQIITVGKLLDTFNSYYNNYYYYISAGYLDASQLLNMVVSSLVQQYMQVDAYIDGHTAFDKAQLTELQKTVPNADYLTKQEFEYTVKYVNYLAYQAFDQYTEDSIGNRYELEEAPAEDTSRDFTEHEDFKDMFGEKAESYAKYTRDQSFVSEEADDYFEENYPFLTVTDEINLEGYVYDLSKDDQKAKAEERVKAYNDRRAEDEEGELTTEEYIEILEDTTKQYKETVQSNYGVSLEAFLKNQLADLVTGCLVANWGYDYYKDIDSAENLDALNEELAKQFESARNAQAADFNISKNFDSFITSLSSSSNIYMGTEGLPAEAENYVFVKNILIPFSDTQTALLTNLQNTLGSTDSDAYIALRNEVAAQITAQYFDSDKYDSKIEEVFKKEDWFEDKKEEDDDESVWYTKEDKKVFSYDAATGELSIDPEGVLGQFLSNGTVAPMQDENGALTPEQTIIELMKRFNTDTAQHTAAYDYVVYVGDDWEDYNHSWVKEFYTAVNEDLVPHDGSEGKQYTLCVSTYGVHIIYLTSKVSESSKIFKAFDPADRLNDGTPSYTLFKTYFDNQMSARTSDAIKALEKDKLSGSSYVTALGGFKKFLKDNSFTFDLDEFVAEMLKEANE